MAPKLTDKERKRIVAYLEAGKSQNWTAKKVGRSVDTVSRIGRKAGIKSDVRTTKRATEASSKLREIDRMEIISLGLRTGAELLESYKDRKATIENIRAYKDLMTGVAIGIDKHRLETGEVTDRSEHHRHDYAREQHFGRLFGELDAYRVGIDDAHRSGDRGVSVDTHSTDDTATEVP